MNEIKYKWQGYRNSDTGTIDGGYLFIKGKGIKIEGVRNRSEAIKKYLLNPDNPNNYKYV